MACNNITTSVNIGEVDSSGLNFFYVSTPRKEDAGIMFFGHVVLWNMLIPPKADDYKIVGMCAAGCTREVYRLVLYVCNQYCISGERILAIIILLLLDFFIMQHIPEKGIKIFANLLHTHLIGKLSLISA